MIHGRPPHKHASRFDRLFRIPPEELDLADMDSERPSPFSVIVAVVTALFTIYSVVCLITAQVTGLSFTSTFVGCAWFHNTEPVDREEEQQRDAIEHEQLKQWMYGRDLYIPTWMVPGHWDHELMSEGADYDFFLRFSRDCNTPSTQDTILLYQTKESRILYPEKVDKTLVEECDGITYTYTERFVNGIHYQNVAWTQDGRQMWLSYQWVYWEDILASEDMLHIAMSMEYCGDKTYSGDIPYPV